MKIIILLIVLSNLVFAEKSKWTFLKNKMLYSAIVNNTEIKVYISTGNFDKNNHKVIEWQEDNLPKVNGFTVIGIDGKLPQASEGFPHLTRLAVKFGDKVVEAPKTLISHIFNPSSKIIFDEKLRYGTVTVSSDGKAVIVNLLVGDGAGSDRVEFIFTSTGKCIIIKK